MKGEKYVSKIPDDNGVIHWTAEENETWNILMNRQKEIIKNRACDEFIECLDLIQFSEDKIPQHTVVNKRLEDFTGWEVHPVPALIPAKEFFGLLANKKFPAASFIRTREELDYLQEPDIFHEFFGHTPLLCNQAYADFMENFGKIALQVEPKWRKRLFRLFWFTIEFGLINTKDGLRAYGGGILSSIGESVYALEDKCAKRVPFDTMTALRTPYRIDIMQPQYFVIDSYDELYAILDQDIPNMLIQSKEMGDFPPLYSTDTEEVVRETPC